jgi:hypothetical protein
MVKGNLEEIQKEIKDFKITFKEEEISVMLNNQKVMVEGIDKLIESENEVNYRLCKDTFDIKERQQKILESQKCNTLGIWQQTCECIIIMYNCFKQSIINQK